MVDFDNGQISTVLISIAGAVLALFIAQPALLQTLMGSYFVQYGAFVLAILAVIYNVLFPRNPAE